MLKIYYIPRPRPTSLSPEALDRLLADLEEMDRYDENKW